MLGENAALSEPCQPEDQDLKSCGLWSAEARNAVRRWQLDTGGDKAILMKNNCSCLKVLVIYTRVNMNIRSGELKVTAKHLFASGIHMGTRTKYLA